MQVWGHFARCFPHLFVFPWHDAAADGQGSTEQPARVIASTDSGLPNCLLWVMLKFPAAGAQHPRQGLSVSNSRPSIVHLPARIKQAGFVPVLLQLAFPM